MTGRPSNGCARCFRPAIAYALGFYRNGRMAVEPLCDHHTEQATDLGTWRNHGATGAPYRFEEIVSVEAAEMARDVRITP